MSDEEMTTDSTYVFCSDDKNPASLALGGYGFAERAKAVMRGSSLEPRGRLYEVTASAAVVEGYGERGGEYVQ